jgi:hypothetical protein
VINLIETRIIMDGWCDYCENIPCSCDSEAEHKLVTVGESGAGPLNKSTEKTVEISIFESLQKVEAETHKENIRLKDKLKILDLQSSLDVVFAYIVQLENESFEGWSDEARNGYITATTSIKEKVRSQFNR